MRSIIDVKADLAALAMVEGSTWSAARVSAVSAALAHPSPVDGVVAGFKALADDKDLSALGRFVLKGLAEQIIAGQFHGLASQAATVLATVADAKDPRP